MFVDGLVEHDVERRQVHGVRNIALAACELVVKGLVPVMEVARVRVLPPLAKPGNPMAPR